MKIIVSRFLPPKGFTAINLFGIIFTRNREEIDEHVIRHEAIHSQQMKYMLYVFFYIWYVGEWLVRLMQYRNPKIAYYNISMEREAYINDQDSQYLQNRKPYAWTKYLRKKSLY